MRFCLLVLLTFPHLTWNGSQATWHTACPDECPRLPPRGSGESCVLGCQLVTLLPIVTALTRMLLRSKLPGGSCSTAQRELVSRVHLIVARCRTTLSRSVRQPMCRPCTRLGTPLHLSQLEPGHCVALGLAKERGADSQLLEQLGHTSLWLRRCNAKILRPACRVDRFVTPVGVALAASGCLASNILDRLNSGEPPSGALCHSSCACINQGFESGGFLHLQRLADTQLITSQATTFVKSFSCMSGPVTLTES